MDCKFPQQLFPTFYYTGPPERTSSCPVEGWGSYGQLLGINHTLTEQGPEDPDLKFQARHTVKGQRWVPVEPIVTPLLPPNKAGKYTSYFSHPPDAMDFPRHMKNFYLDNPQDAFGTMSSILAEHFYFGSEPLNAQAKKTSVSMKKMKHFLSHANYEKCPLTYLGKRAKQYNCLLGDIIHDIPPGLLGELLHDELALQWQQKNFDEVATGGAVGYFQLTSSDTFQEGCLIYPRNAALNSLEFQKVVLKVDNSNSLQLSLQNSPITYKLNGTVRQISVGRMEESVHVGVRSDYCCGVWVATHTLRPVPREVIKTETRTTCLTVSPHIPGELLVASESGAAHLWTVGQCLSKFREEEVNLYFNAQSQWRWCDFSAHPRVMLYADRTGLELTDIRSKENCSHTLFRIGQTPDCKTGERVMLSKYLFDVNAYHHLVTTQYSAYIMDERFPCLPMIKWDHMMADPPVFAQVLGRPSQGGNNKVLLGSQNSQEIMLLQYSGGDVLACHSVGPPQKLISPMSCLRHLPGQIPHRKLKVQERLEVPAAGMTSIYHTGEHECLCALQLTERGDLFYHFLTPAENEPQSSNNLLVNVQPTAEWSDSLLCQSQKHMMDMTVNGEQRTPQLEVESNVVGNEDPASTSDVEICGISETSASQTLVTHCGQVGTSLLKDSANQKKPSKKILMKWKSWLNTLHSKQNQKKGRKYKALHWTLATKGLVSLDNSQRDDFESAQMINLRNDMKEIMKTKQVLVHGITSLPPQEVLPTPDPVDIECWGNDLSQRLSMSWDGRWKNWWEEKLGLNLDKKIEELWRKRRQQKRARARSRVSLSGSFTSSVGCPSDLDDFSAASSFGDSQPPDLDTDSVYGYLSSQENPFLESDNVTSVDVEKREEKSKHSKPNLVQVDSGNTIPVGTKIKTHEARFNQELYLSSLFSSQEEFREATEQSSFSFPLSMSSQVSSISASQRKPFVGPSLGSTPSRPTKKRSRMGF
ncbi:TATA box-binding protein-associated factor RNA polymerase I subunit C [Arapaima gigas]